MREKVVHLACSRSCHGFMCLWESTELQAAAWKMCTAATSAPSETPRARHSKDLEENPNTANTWNADWGRSVKVHKPSREMVKMVKIVLCIEIATEVLLNSLASGLVIFGAVFLYVERGDV